MRSEITNYTHNVLSGSFQPQIGERAAVCKVYFNHKNFRRNKLSDKKMSKNFSAQTKTQSEHFQQGRLITTITSVTPVASKDNIKD